MRVATKTLITIVALTRLAVGQSTAPGQRAGAMVGGVVRDSLAHHPLSGAIVQLVDADARGPRAQTATTDSLGRFSIGDVADGRYVIGFLHPALDSIGLEAPTREVVVNGGRSVRIDLAVPSAQRLRAAICRTAAKNDSTGIVLGFARDATTREALDSARVVGEWAEYTLTRNGFARTLPRIVATTGDNGWFALCGVPAGGTVALSATRGADSTSLIEVEVPAEGFAHRDLYLGAARSVIVMDSSVTTPVVADSAARADTVVRVPRLVRTGGGRLSGTVRRAPGATPLAGAQITIVDGPQTRADAQGAWTIADAPLGTRMLEVRAVGYYPERRAIDITPQTPPLELALSTLKAVLDTVRVHATTLYSRDRNGFQQRRRSGSGRYITPDDIERRHPINLSDMLRMTPGLYLRRGADSFSQEFMMRGFGADYCSPSVYLDGMQLFSLDVNDLDATVRPGDVTGIEIYTSTSAPAQFQRAFSGCGSIVVWTK